MKNKLTVGVGDWFDEAWEAVKNQAPGYFEQNLKHLKMSDDGVLFLGHGTDTIPNVLVIGEGYFDPWLFFSDDIGMSHGDLYCIVNDDTMLCSAARLLYHNPSEIFPDLTQSDDVIVDEYLDVLREAWKDEFKIDDDDIDPVQEIIEYTVMGKQLSVPLENERLKDTATWDWQIEIAKICRMMHRPVAAVNDEFGTSYMVDMTKVPIFNAKTLELIPVIGGDIQ